MKKINWNAIAHLHAECDLSGMARLLFVSLLVSFMHITCYKFYVFKGTHVNYTLLGYMIHHHES